ncbi:hypothetical protein CAAN1_12S00265 [[Candida] anglica]|uniref:F-box domain-containing protein n=1 Tax=[Candida] anglica TaxID=148631 RepID=A0ABP0E953_9ASCO
MSIYKLLDRLPYELLEHLFSFFTIKDDLSTLTALAGHPEVDPRIKRAVYGRILRFVVVDPSCWAKEFTRGDYWYPTLVELKGFLRQVDGAVAVALTSTVQLCVYHNFQRNRHDLEDVFRLLSGKTGAHLNLTYRVYVEDREEEVCRCVGALESHGILLSSITDLQLVCTNGGHVPIPGIPRDTSYRRGLLFPEVVR